jgi:hypothetical protein
MDVKLKLLLMFVLSDEKRPKRLYQRLNRSNVKDRKIKIPKAQRKISIANEEPAEF